MTAGAEDAVLEGVGSSCRVVVTVWISHSSSPGFCWMRMVSRINSGEQLGLDRVAKKKKVFWVVAFREGDISKAWKLSVAKARLLFYTP